MQRNQWGQTRLIFLPHRHTGESDLQDVVMLREDMESEATRIQ